LIPFSILRANTSNNSLHADRVGMAVSLIHCVVQDFLIFLNSLVPSTRQVSSALEVNNRTFLQGEYYGFMDLLA